MTSNLEHCQINKHWRIFLNPDFQFIINAGLKYYCENTMLNFHLDRCDQTVAGWIFDSEHENLFFSIDIILNGRLYATTVADIYRRDLELLGLRPNSGFSIDLDDFSSVDHQKVISIAVYAKYHGVNSILLGQGFFEKKTKAVIDSGWIFLINDSNRSEDYLQGIIQHPSEIIKANAEYIDDILKYLLKKSIKSVFVVLPDKAVTCNSFRSKPLLLSDDRQVVRLFDYLGDLGKSHVIYPVSKFTELASSCYLKTDTHLSAKGYLELIKILSNIYPGFLLH